MVWTQVEQIRKVITWYTTFIHYHLSSLKTWPQLMREERSLIRTTTSPCRVTSDTMLMKWKSGLLNTSLESWGRIVILYMTDTNTILSHAISVVASKIKYWSFNILHCVCFLNSEELLSALGIDGNTLPPLIYRMRQLGYPPGWLKEAEMENSGLTLYDGNGMFLNEIDTCVVLLLFFSLRKLLESIPMFLKCTEVELNLHFFFFFLPSVF